MITKRTVFVLGAGASRPYDFPTGIELYDQILMGDTETFSLAGQLERFEIQRPITYKFFDDLRKVNLPSIDRFLTRRRDHEQVGKLAIAILLRRRELEAMQTLFNRLNTDHWYSLLWHELIGNETDPNLVPFENVRVVNFNYDRSPEYFLQETTKAWFKLDNAAAHRVWSRIQMIHVYGVLGSTDFSTDDGLRTYTGWPSVEGMKMIADGIKVIPLSQGRDEIEFVQAREYFAWAEQICFLGFGFDELNVKRLDLQSVLEELKKQAEPSPKIYASLFNGNEQAAKEIHNRLCPGTPVGWCYNDNSRTIIQNGILV